MKNKKKILHIVEIVLAVAIVITLVCIGIVMYKNSRVGKPINSKINKLNKELSEKTEYGFKTTSDQNDEIYFAKKDNKTYIKIKFKGDSSEFIIEDNQTHLIKKEDNCLFTYENNDRDKNKIEEALNGLKDIEPKKGKEKINGQKLKYEEYNKIIPLTMIDTSEDPEGYTMRFYFKGNDLKYIKTFKENKTEILKVEIEDTVDSKIFEIPNNIKENK